MINAKWIIFTVKLVYERMNQRWETDVSISVVLDKLQFTEVRLKEFALEAGLHMLGPKVLAKVVFFISNTSISLGSSMGYV